MLEANLGSAERVENILSLLNQDGIGAVTPEHFEGVATLIQWGGNFETARALMGMMGENISREGCLDLPAGSMFWFRSDALKPLLNIDLTIDHFDPEEGQIDGTLAHAIERIFLPVVEAAGYGYLTVAPTDDPCMEMRPDEVRSSANRFRPMRSDLGPASDHYPHTAGYLTKISRQERPRLNLLLPTADRGKAYAGVSAALEVFSAIRNELGERFDARVISTDVPISDGTQSLAGYDLSVLDCSDFPHQDTIVDGTQRRTAPMSIRKRDIFMGTAWWTMHQAELLSKNQAGHFKIAPRKRIYLIQDYENGFEPWSTAWALADATYTNPTQTIPIFNTPILSDFFRESGYYEDGHILYPAINADFLANVAPGSAKEKVVLLYARPHASRNCLEFLDMIVRTAIQNAPDTWKGWRFIAIGEDFGSTSLPEGSPIEVQGRLSLDQYAQMASRAALAISLMVSPHPSYPPLEMAAAGVQVLTNTYCGRNSADLHQNISSFSKFNAEAVGQQLSDLARNWTSQPEVGWHRSPKIDWFFDGKTNIAPLAASVAREIEDLVTPQRWVSAPSEVQLKVAS